LHRCSKLPGDAPTRTREPRDGDLLGDLDRLRRVLDLLHMLNATTKHLRQLTAAFEKRWAPAGVQRAELRRQRELAGCPRLSQQEFLEDLPGAGGESEKANMLFARDNRWREVFLLPQLQLLDLPCQADVEALVEVWEAHCELTRLVLSPPATTTEDRRELGRKAHQQGVRAARAYHNFVVLADRRILEGLEVEKILAKPARARTFAEKHQLEQWREVPTGLEPCRSCTPWCHQMWYHSWEFLGVPFSISSPFLQSPGGP
jgi:hypothetical protein